MSNRYWLLPGLELTPDYSPCVRLVVFLVLGLAILALWHSALHWLVGSAASMLLILRVGMVSSRRRPDFAARRIQRLYCDDGCWRLDLYSGDSGDSVAIHPQSDSVVLPWLVVLRARADHAGQSCTLVLTADAFSAECWRRLQLNLRQTLSARPG